jgi:hsp70-interacting protein
VAGTHCVMHSQVPSPSYLYHPSPHSCMMHSSRALRSDSDIGVRRKAAFLLNSLLTSSAPASAATRTSAGSRIHSGPAQAAPVHPVSHASMLADPTSVDTATETLRALHAHGLLPVLVRELTEPTPYGQDGDEGDGCDADLEEKLIRCVSRSNYVCI